MPTSLWIAIDNTKALGNTFLFTNVFQRFRNLAFLFVLFLIAFTISKQDSTCNARRQELIVRVLSVKPKAWNDTEGKPVRRGWKKIIKQKRQHTITKKSFYVSHWKGSVILESCARERNALTSRFLPWSSVRLLVLDRKVYYGNFGRYK